MKIKMYCIFSKESLAQMKGIRGKMAAQAGHGFLHSFWDAEQRFPDDAKSYKSSDHAYKITLVVDTTEELTALYNHYYDRCGVSLVKDAGFTVFRDEEGNPVPTVTCLGIGPIPEDRIDDHLKNLRTLT
jgi:peptidyl-tRNA hydrolase